MAKRYYLKDGDAILVNGRSMVRCGFMHHMAIDTHPGRVIKVLTVANVLCQSEKNPLEVGNMLAISFPEDAVNRKEYEWHPGEEFAVTLQMIPLEEMKANAKHLANHDPLAEPEG